MKKISALVATVVLGISGVVAAAPNSYGQVHSPAQFRPVARPAPYGWNRWTMLDTAQLRGGRDVIAINSPQRFTKLKLEATRGMASIDKVLVTFGNGRTQLIEVDQRLGGRGNSSAVLDLDGRGDRGRQIKSIVIYGHGGRFMRASALTISAA
jgi:hypothetical protein